MMMSFLEPFLGGASPAGAAAAADMNDSWE